MESSEMLNSERKTVSVASKWSLVLLFIAVGLTTFSLLVIGISSNEGEIVSAKMIWYGLFVFFGLPAVVLVSFLGCVLAVIALYQTRGRAGKAGLSLNLVVFVTCSAYLWAVHSGFLQRMRTGQSKLEYALQRNNLKMLKHELKKGADVNLQLQQGDTPLHLAIRRRDRELLKILLAHGADVNAQTHFHSKEGQTPLHYLAGQDIPRSKETAWDSFEIAKLLLERGADPNVRAIDGVWPKRNGVTPLTLAYEKGHKEMVDLLLSYGADVNVAGGNQGISLFHLAVKRSDEEMVGKLIRRGADINAAPPHSNTVFGFAILYSTKEILEMLIASYPEAVNAKNEERSGETPLHVAANSGRAEILELLLNNGADIRAKCCEGATALHFATNREVAELLVANGLDIDARTNKGATALYCVVSGLDAELVEYLIAKGADVNARANSGETPLHGLTYNWSKEIAEVLINAGADIYAKDNRGRTFVSRAQGSRKRGGGAGRRLQETLAFLEELEQGTKTESE